MDNADEAFLESFQQPIELTHLQAPASAPMALNAEWVAYLDRADVPHHVAGVDDGIRHDVAEGGTAYA